MAPQVLEHPGTRPTEERESTVDTKSLAHETHQPCPDHKLARSLLAVLLSLCAECGTQDADYFARVPQGHPMFMEGEELCPECGADHGVL
jgi:hypothetical protein